MSGEHPAPDKPASKFRATLIRVVIVQVVALVLLWVLQFSYTP